MTAVATPIGQASNTQPAQPAMLHSSTAGALSSRAMLAVLSIKTWSPRKLDKQVTREVAQQKGVTGDPGQAGRYTKNLIPHSDSLEAIQTIVSQARQEFYHRTLPWSQDGSRILSADAYLDLQAVLGKLETDFKHAVQKFVQAYPNLQALAQTELAQLYDANDYPDAGRLPEKFRWKFNVLPLPDAQDFRVDLGDDLTAQMRSSIEAEVNATVADAMQDAWKRLFERVGYVVERLDDPTAVFRDSLLTGLRDLTATMRKLNLTNDTNLEHAIRDLEDRVLTHPPDELRKNASTRQNVAADARAIHERMAGFLNAPTSNPSNPAGGQ